MSKRPYQALKSLGILIALPFYIILLVYNFIVTIQKENKNKEMILKSGIRDIDSLNGYKFEKYLSYIFKNMGCQRVVVTKGSRDFGADLIAEKDGKRIVIQAKRYTGRVNLKAVQEIYSAKQHYSADIAIVVTNNYFSESAIVLAKSTHVYLWDRSKLAYILKNMNDAQKNNRRICLVV